MSCIKFSPTRELSKVRPCAAQASARALLSSSFEFASHGYMSSESRQGSCARGFRVSRVSMGFFPLQINNGPASDSCLKHWWCNDCLGDENAQRSDMSEVDTLLSFVKTNGAKPASCDIRLSQRSSRFGPGPKFMHPSGAACAVARLLAAAQ